MPDSEVNRLKTGAFTFGFETLPPSSCLSHLTLLVSYLIFSYFIRLVKSLEFIDRKNVNNILLPTRNKVSQREKKVT